MNTSYDFSEFPCENVTMRTKNKSTSLLNISTSKCMVNNTLDSYYLDTSSQTLPNNSILDESAISEYKLQIERLHIELSSAHVEIEKLNSENMELKKQLKSQEKTIKLFKKIGISDTLEKDITTPKIARMKKILNKGLQEINRNSLDCSLSYSQKKVIPKNTHYPEHKEKSGSIRLTDIKLNKRQNEDIIYETNQNLSTLKDPKFIQKTIKRENTRSSKILIFGEQQTSGLASKLTDSLKGKWNDNYKIFGTVKPYAKCRDILSCCNMLESELCWSDRVILSIGTNDTNPFEICKELCLTLNRLKKPKIFIMPINNNNKINTYLLNNHISSIAKLYENCIFLNKSEINFEYNYLESLANYLIHEIAKVDYYDKYITKSKTLQNHRISYALTSSEFTPRKGTIPYYFKIKSKKNSSKKEQIDSNNSNILNHSHKKGTIPYYFKKSVKKRKNTFFRDQTV